MYYVLGLIGLFWLENLMLQNPYRKDSILLKCCQIELTPLSKWRLKNACASFLRALIPYSKILTFDLKIKIIKRNFKFLKMGIG